MNTTVRLIFDLGGASEYTFPLVQAIADPIPAMEATVIPGNRASGSICIPGGQKSIEIGVKGILWADGYAAIESLKSTMRTKVTTAVATLTLRYWSGSAWVNTWQYTVRRLEEITFEEESLRTYSQKYECRFLVLSY